MSEKTESGFAQMYKKSLNEKLGDLQTENTRLKAENAKYREALEKARTAINEWKGTPHVKTGDIVIRISRYIKSALLAEKHDTAAGEGE